MHDTAAFATQGILCLVAAVGVVLALAIAPAYGLTSSLVLDPVPDRAYAGDKVTFTGTLTGGGYALSGRMVHICEDDPLWPDKCLASGTTDGAGRFHIEWAVRDSAVETDFDIYAKFNGDSRYDSGQTPRQEMSVYGLRGGQLVLDPVQDSAWFGEVVHMSGTLSLDGRSPEGAIVYIKDEDTFNPDDLLASAYVNASGHFTTYWIAQDVDPTNTIEIQAVFERDASHRRLTSSIQKMSMSELPSPAPARAGGDGYMELYFSHSFDRAPRVLIVPSPDSYDSVRKHIAPVQEGISLLTTMLEQEYAHGDWGVDVRVVEPGGRAGFEPDVFVNLVTREEDTECQDAFGYAILFQSPIKPVQTVVCSLDRSNSGIISTTMHEFIHAMGIGHTFNIRDDMLCSKEIDYGYTCPRPYDKSEIPSELNLAAVAAVYGTDGFQNPNNGITYKERFTLNGGQSDGSTTPPRQDAAGGHQESIFTDSDQYKEGEVILVDGVYTGEHEESLSLYLTDRYGEVVATTPVFHGAVMEEFFLGVHPAGTYTVWLFDEHDWVEGPSFVISGIDDAVIYADYTWYYPGEAIYLDGFYWGSYNGQSELLVLDPLADAVVQQDVDVVEDFFGVYIDGHYLPGRYLVLLYDDSGRLAASTAFHVLSDP